MPARVPGNAPRHRPSPTRSPRPLVLCLSCLSRSPGGSSIRYRLLWPRPALKADHAGPVPLVRTGGWPQRCLSRGEATVPSPRAWPAMATEAVVPAAVTGKVAARNPANPTQAGRDVVWRPGLPGRDLSPRRQRPGTASCRQAARPRWPGRSPAHQSTTWTPVTGPASTRRTCSPAHCWRPAGRQRLAAAAHCAYQPDTAGPRGRRRTQRRPRSPGSAHPRPAIPRP